MSSIDSCHSHTHPLSIRIVSRVVTLALLSASLLVHSSGFAENPEDHVKDARKKLNKLNISFAVEEFMDCAKQGDVTAVELFLTAGMYHNVKDENRWSALMWAAAAGSTEIVELLLEKGADVNTRNADGATALMLADAAGHCETVNILLEHGAKAYPGSRLQTVRRR